MEFELNVKCGVLPFLMLALKGYIWDLSAGENSWPLLFIASICIFGSKIYRNDGK